MQDVNLDINPMVQNVQDGNGQNDQALQDDDQMDIDVMEDWVPHHPDQPQDTVTFDQSGSTANYLRATRPNVYLDVDKILAAIHQGEILAAIQTNDGSSKDSGAVSSVRLPVVVVPPFIVQACQKLGASALLVFAPVLPVTEWKEEIGKAIVPVQPVMGSVLIRIWVALFGDVHDSQRSVVSGRAVVGPISLPTMVSRKPGSKTPLVDTLVRRSSCFNPNVVDGVQVVKIKEPASKRWKRAVPIKLDNPPKNADEAADPVPLDVL